MMAECIIFLNQSNNHFIQNLSVYLWTNYTPAFKTPRSNGKLIITMKVKDQHIFHAVAMLFYSLQKSP